MFCCPYSHAEQQKAQNLFNSKDYVQAIDILNTIFDKHNDAPAKLAECKLKLGQQTSAKSEKLKFFNEVVEIRKRISNSSSVAKFESIEAKALFEEIERLWPFGIYSKTFSQNFQSAKIVLSVKIIILIDKYNHFER